MCMRAFSKQSSGSESEPENSRSWRFSRWLAITVLGTMQLLLISLVTRSQAQESVLDSSDVLDGLLAFLPLISNPQRSGASLVRPNPATGTTNAANQAVLGELPFNNTSDYDNVSRDLVAPLPEAGLVDNEGNTIWDPTKYDFIKTGSDAPGSVNPSLWPQAQLVNASGLFKVTDRLYQARFFILLETFPPNFNIMTP